MIQNTLLSLLVCFATAASTLSALGANVVLRSQSMHTGPMVYLGDIAEISAATPGELQELKHTSITPAPAPGTLQYLSRAQVRDMLVASGISLFSLDIGGAEVVELGQAKALPQVDQQTTIPSRSRQQIERALEDSITNYLIAETGHDGWRIAIEFDAKSLLQAASLSDDLEVSGGHRPWTGRQYFNVSDARHEESVRVTTKITRFQTVVTTLRPIARGDLIRASDLQTEVVEGSLQSTTITEPSQIIGMQAKQSIGKGKVISRNQIAAPLQVERGETVTVFARTAGIAVRTYAVARQDGALGDLIQVETLDKKDRYAARVSGLRELEVLAAGASVRDYASLPRHNTVLR